MGVLKIVFWVFWSLLLVLEPAFAESRLSGHILDEQGAAVKNFTIHVGDMDSIPGRDGAFSGISLYGDVITVQITAEGYYPIRHTFDVQELESLQTGGRALPPITLVAKKAGRVMLAFGGDVMMARRFSTPREGEKVLIRGDHKAADTRDIVKHIKPYFDVADFGSVNLESQVIAERPQGSSTKSITFFSPPETVDTLAWAGIDYVTLGNNHTYDNLKEGLVSTLDILAGSTLGFSGAGLNEQQALAAYRTSISGVPYSFLGYVGWKGGGRPHQAAEGSNKGGAALGSLENIMDSVGREAGQGQTTVVQYHGSLEYSEEPTLVTEQKLKSAIDRGADIAIAHHPHVVQGFEIYKDRLIAYSLGNFIFDQYYYGPQFSYMLYVWMDGEKFHRAEIVPLYIKGYKPTPAVGIVRSAVLKRVATLSARRNVSLGYSGGHGVITRTKPQVPQKVKLPVALKADSEQELLLSLDHCAASQFVTGLTSLDGDVQYRLGQELLRRGDFENFDSFEAPERGWLPQNDGSGAEGQTVYQGRQAFKVTADDGQKTSIFGMKVFTRIYKPGNPMTFAGQVFGVAGTTLDFYLQVRPTRWGLKKSLASGPKQHLGSLMATGDGWQKFALDFNTPRVGVHSFRILVEASAPKDQPEGDKVDPLYYDDVALIQWQTAYRQSAGGQEIPAPNRITHMGLRGLENPSEKLEILLLDHGATHKKCNID